MSFLSNNAAPDYGERGAWRTSSLGYCVATSVGILVSGLTVMVLLDTAFSDWRATETAIDVFAFLVVLIPFHYVFLFRPMSRHANKRIQAENALRALAQELESRVARRTADLERANQALTEEAEARHRATKEIRFQSSLLNAVEQGVVATDPDGRVLYWNRFAERLLGWGPEEALGRKVDELAQVRTASDETEALFPILSREPSGVREAEIVRPDGSQVAVWLSCSPVRDETTRPVGSVCILADVTDRKQAEEALRYSEEKYSVLVENSPTAIFLLREGRIVLSNQMLVEMLGHSQEELAQLPPYLWVFPEDRRTAEAAVETPEAGKDWEFRVIGKDGEVRWMSLRATSLPYRGGRSILANAKDITTRKQMETALSESREQLRRLSARLIEAQEEERRRIARELHDGIGQSLAGIKYLLEVGITRAKLGEEPTALMQALVPPIQDAVRELRGIMMALRPALLDEIGLIAAIRWLAGEFGAKCAGIRFGLRIEVEEPDIPISLRAAVFRILQEALTNATRHGKGDRVLVSLEKADGALALAIEDNGRGFDPDALRPGEGGRGFGIGVMQERAALSGGTVEVESRKGKGTTVRARWPLEAALSD